MFWLPRKLNYELAPKQNYECAEVRLWQLWHQLTVKNSEREWRHTSSKSEFSVYIIGGMCCLVMTTVIGFHITLMFWKILFPGSLLSCKCIGVYSSVGAVPKFSFFLFGLFLILFLFMWITIFFCFADSISSTGYDSFFFCHQTSCPCF